MKTGKNTSKRVGYHYLESLNMQFISIIELLYLSHKFGPKLSCKTTYKGRNSHIIVKDKEGMAKYQFFEGGRGERGENSSST